MPTFGDRVREARLGARPKKLSQAELAKRCSVSQPTIHDIEAGEIKATHLCVPIAMATGYSAIWLWTGQGPKRQSLTERLRLSESEDEAAAAFIQTMRDSRRR